MKEKTKNLKLKKSVNRNALYFPRLNALLTTKYNNCKPILIKKNYIR